MRLYENRTCPLDSQEKKRRRQGIHHSLATRLKDLEADISQPAASDYAQRMQQKLGTLDMEFRGHHQDIVDLTVSEDSLASEQDVLDEQDDLVAELSVKQLIIACSTSDATPRKIATRRLVLKTLSDLSTAIGALGEDADDMHRLSQHKEQLIDLTKDLSETRSSLLTLDLAESDDLATELTSLSL